MNSLVSKRDGTKGGAENADGRNLGEQRQGGCGEAHGGGFFEDDDGETRKVGSTWWSSGPVVVMVPSGGVAVVSKHDATDATREGPLSLCTCAIFSDGPKTSSSSYVFVRGTRTGFFLRHGLSLFSSPPRK